MVERELSKAPEESAHIILLGAPRSGAGLLQQLLLADPAWVASPLSAPAAVHLDESEPGFAAAVASALEQAGPRTVDWIPRWSMRVAALRAAAPEAKFVYLIRDPRYAVSSAVTAWRSGRFVSAPDLAGWWGEKWSFPLVPQWESLIGRPLHEVVASQWFTIAETIRRDVAGLDASQLAVVTYEQLVEDPESVIEGLVEQLGITWTAELPDELPPSPFTVTAPNPTRPLPDIEETLAAFTAVAQARESFLAFAAQHGGESYADPLSFSDSRNIGGVTRSSDGTPFKSSHTKSFVELLEKSGSSVILTTYKSGHVIVARAHNGRLDTAITQMNRPMGVASAGGRLAIGTADSVVTYANHPSLGASLGSARSHDAVYVPRVIAFTGDVSIHEMDYDAEGQLWFVNTRFSCLCTLDMDNSFTPRWRPKWISALASEDRCHLNGLTMANGRPKYVTALARTDTANGWREHKGTSGVIVDVTSDEVIVDGLAMPHSPRLHNGFLWVLESGKGALVRIDLVTGERTQVATVPGFSRGLAFIGRYAIIGLSQVRESVFSGLPVTQTAAERNCGAWVVDIEAGAIVGLLKFSGVVQEIFDVQVLPQTSWPIITAPGELTAGAFSLGQDAIAQLRTD